MAKSLSEELKAFAASVSETRSTRMLEQSLRRGCWIYGAGGYGQSIAALLAARGIEALGFIDRRAGALALASLPLPVVHPDACLSDGTVLVVAMHNFANDQLPVVRWARGAGFADVIIPAELPDLLGPDAGSYWLTGRFHLLDHLEPLAETISLLADATSVQTMSALARFRISGEIEEHPEATIQDQYFPADIGLPSEPLRIVDGGAYIGDALASVARAGGRIDEWYAFEPDHANFERLAATVASADLSRAALFPCGLGDSLKTLRFATGEADGSRVAEGGESTIQVVALDDVLHGARPNFIKLDIEGAEADALDGMSQTLARCRPRVAMSIYHKPADLWELPLKLAAMMPGAKLYVRQHGFNGFDTVLYAVP